MNLCRDDARGPHSHRLSGERENVYLAPSLRRETKGYSTVGEGLRAESQRLIRGESDGACCRTARDPAGAGFHGSQPSAGSSLAKYALGRGSVTSAT